MRIVEVGQYFVTKDTGNIRQFRSVACREYTLPRDDPASQPKGWIQGNMRIGPVLVGRRHTEIPVDPQASKLLQPDQKQKQNHNREKLPYQCTKEDGLVLSHQNKILLRTISRRK